MARFAVVLSLLVAAVPFTLGKTSKPTAASYLLSSARSVYITSPSGDEFGMFPMPEDKEALVAMRGAIANSQQLRMVYAKEKADIIVVVSSRARRDAIRVLDGQTPTKCIWHLAEKNGLRGTDPPLAKALEAELENARNTATRLEPTEK